MSRKGFRALTATQARMLLREPAAVLWLVFPLALLILFGNIPAFRTAQDSLGGKSVIDVCLPTIAGMVPVFLGCVMLPINMANLREKGILRRLSVSPVPATGLLGALLVVIAGLIVVGVALILAIGRLAFHVSPPVGIGAVCAAFALGSTAVLALGLLLAAVVPNPGAASGTGVPIMVLNYFFSGLYIPVAEMPRVLRETSDYIPLGAVTAAWSGQGALWAHLLVLAGYTLAGSVLAARAFRWK
jgi:ABC-2 type transport system permease protein